jgi:iron-sulfur cluster assembly protein
LLNITTDAADAIKTAIESLGAPDSAGVRISTSGESYNGSGPAVELSFVPEPAREDEVVEDEGAQVFIAPGASNMVADKTLDVDYEPGGEIRFSLVG